MTTTRETRRAKGKARRMGVYQTLPPGRPPARIEIRRFEYMSVLLDGATFGRSPSRQLLSLASGTTALTAADEAKLRAVAVDDDDMAYINERLAELEGPAHAHARECQRIRAVERTRKLLSEFADDAACREVIITELHSALGATSMLGAKTCSPDGPQSRTSVQPEAPSPLEQAMLALDLARKALVVEASRHRDAGLRLTSQRSVDTTVPPGANDLDKLQARANRIRRELFPAFELACKAAGLMVSKGS